MTSPSSVRSALAFSFVCLASSLACADGFARSPYVQQPTSSRALVAFTLDASCPASVEYGPGTDRSNVASNEAAARHHVLELTGLPPATEIGYEVFGCGEPTGEGGEFRTAPVRGTREVNFAAVGDFGTGGKLQQELVQRLIEDRPEFLLALGDVAYNNGTPTEVEEHFIGPMAELFADVPVYVALGNHEYYTDEGRPTLDAIYMPNNNAKRTERYYSFDWGHVHFVALDTMCSGIVTSGGECTAEEQEAWLAADLAATDQPWKVVFFHHPPYTSSPKDSRSAREKLVPLMQQGGVDLVLTGHAHNYERSFPLTGGTRDDEDGIVYVVAGAGGANLKEFDANTPPDWSAYRNNTEFGYLDVSVEGGVLAAQARTLDGRTIDAFELTKQLPPEEVPDAGTASEPDAGTAPEPDAGTSLLDGGDDGPTTPTFEPSSGGSSCASAGVGLVPGALLGLLALGVRRRRARTVASGR